MLVTLTEHLLTMWRHANSEQMLATAIFQHSRSAAMHAPDQNMRLKPELGSNAPAGLNLKLWVLCEGDSDGVAQAIHEQGANADGALHPAVLPLSSL